MGMSNPMLQQEGTSWRRSCRRGRLPDGYLSYSTYQLSLCRSHLEVATYSAPCLYNLPGAILDCQSLKLFLLLPVSRDFTRMWTFFSKYFVNSVYVKLEITTRDCSQYKNEYSARALGIRPCYTSRARNFKHGSTHGYNIKTLNSLILTVTVQVFGCRSVCNRSASQCRLEVWTHLYNREADRAFCAHLMIRNFNVSELIMSISFYYVVKRFSSLCVICCLYMFSFSADFEACRHHGT
jgi:hypothetical protein